MSTLHTLGFPRIGAKRELKFALEAFWNGQSGEAELLATARELRQRHWLAQKAAGIERVPVGDFALYDQVLDAQILVGAVPRRFGLDATTLDLAGYFALARGNAGHHALEMTKWFDTNYHYLVPEWHADTAFSANPERLLTQVREAQALGLSAKPVLVGPLTLLWLGKTKGAAFDRLSLLPGLLATYRDLLAALAGAGVDWVQIDEPILALDLPADWLAAFSPAYQSLADSPVKLLLATYFGSVAEHAALINALPVAGVHLDLARAPDQLDAFLPGWPAGRVLSAGLIDGRNVWRADLARQLALALNDEVLDLEAAGIRVIQIDEPAIREGLPLKRADWDQYLAWAGEAFRLSSHRVGDATQIHTHMCYSEFNDILEGVAALDADVITIETSRSDMDLLTAFGEFAYPNEIGPGVYDIHSPRIPAEAEIERLLNKALAVIPAERLWVNPDCGLKTRGWPEVEAALANMMAATKRLRAGLGEMVSG